MEKTNNGGPAFPVEQHDKDGMTLLDYFAAKAMQAYVAHGKSYGVRDIASVSYRIARAMIEERVEHE